MWILSLWVPVQLLPCLYRVLQVFLSSPDFRTSLYGVAATSHLWTFVTVALSHSSRPLSA